jgi:hypothetical protein
MKTRKLMAIFALGVLILVAIIWRGITGPRIITGTSIYPDVTVVLIGAFALVTGALVYLSMSLNGKERWTALMLAAILILLFSILAIFSIGIFIAPVGLLLLGVSLWKRFHYRGTD